jgi:hypothetical protein
MERRVIPAVAFFIASGLFVDTDFPRASWSLSCSRFKGSANHASAKGVRIMHLSPFTTCVVRNVAAASCRIALATTADM